MRPCKLATILLFALSAVARAGDPPGTTTRPGDLDETKSLKRVVIALDRSGSMSIGDRFPVALDQVDKVVGALPKTSKMNVILFDTAPVFLFKDGFIEPRSRLATSVRDYVKKAGGVQPGGFTDISAALKAALGGQGVRPDAIYLVSDGVPTRGELETDKLLAAVKALASSPRAVPIHVLAVRGEAAAAENDDGARAVLEGIAKVTGGKYREVELPKRASALALKPAKSSSDQDDVDFRLVSGGAAVEKEVKSSEVTFPHFTVEIDDAYFRRGDAIFEYAAPVLDVRTRLENGSVFDEQTDVQLEYRGKGVFASVRSLKFVRPMDERQGTKYGVGEQGEWLFLKVPTGDPGRVAGSIELSFRRERGGKERKKIILVRTPLAGP